jgi:hypothetical protein
MRASTVGARVSAWSILLVGQSINIMIALTIHKSMRHLQINCPFNFDLPI